MRRWRRGDAPGCSERADHADADADGNGDLQVSVGVGMILDDSDPDSGSDPDDTTVDTLLRGRVTLVQPRRGFRSSLDPLLLARFLAPPHGRFLDIGCGTGALSFTLLADDPSASGVGVELQARLAHLAGLGRARNALDNRFQV